MRKSDFLLHLVSFLCIIGLSFPLVNAYELSATPDEFTLEIKSNKQVCNEVEITSSSGNVSFSTLWSAKKSRNLVDFTYSPEELNVTIKHRKTLNSKREDVEFCVKIQDNYAYYGVFLIEDASRGGGIGVWITINKDGRERSITPKESLKSKIKRSITGNAISEDSPEEPAIGDYLVMSAVGSGLLLIALILWAHHKRRISIV